MAMRLGALIPFFLVPATAQQLAISAHSLSNGMKVLIHEDHDIPNVAMYLFYKVGSRNERPGATGMSHFFEHMMFNGAKKYGPKQFDIQMEKNGGRNNAYTSRDITAYTDWFPTSSLELMFDLEADRIRDLAFDPKMIESERGVVYSERRNAIDNSNSGLLSEQLFATAYIAHPYQWPVVGWASDIEAWTIDDLKEHYRMGYAPNNCVLVLVGAVKEAEVLRLARKYLEPIPKQDPPPPVRTKEPPQLGERRVTLRRPDARAPLVYAAWHVPETRHADSLSLEVLSLVLSAGRSSRLHRRLVEKDQLALSVEASYQDGLDPSVFLINAQVRPGADPTAVEKALYDELDALGSSGLTGNELAKVRNQVLTSFYRQIRTIAGKANIIGQAEVFHGDYRKINSYAEDVQKISAADLQRVAKQYLTPTNRTVATLLPGREESR